ncbi:polyprenol reductase 2-like [Diospyros lotus]|uniref:polyprenol reductase 2-like n=1 Tax=Diospyros lotus TaxID=55363 RepID=UPI002256222A|nr:polyprenol reductase 2-like [Diospyros lotus]
MEMGLVVLLRAAWLAGMLPMLGQWLFGFARRGNTTRSPSNKFTVPLKFVSHFYALAVVWTTFLLITTWFYVSQDASLLVSRPSYSTILKYLTGGSNIFSFHKSHRSMVVHGYEVWQSIILLLLMEIQALRRLIESIYGFEYGPSDRMHIFVYLSGLLFYTAAPLSLCCTVAPEVFKFAASQVAEFIVKGKDHTPAFDFDWWVFVSLFMKLKWYSWTGVATFLWGWYQQLQALAIFSFLSESFEQADSSYDNWLDLVLSPHYETDIVMYASFVIVSRGADLTIWLLFGFVAASLAAYNRKNRRL